MDVALAVTYHDPQGRLYEHIARVLPFLTAIFSGLAVQASHEAHQSALELLVAAGGHVRRTPPDRATGVAQLGRARRAAIELALSLDIPSIMYCDCDRIVHWAERFPAELAGTVERIAEHDLTVIGRTQRAFDSHPRAQCDTERIVNHVFELVSGYRWDITAAARGLSRRVAGAIVEGCLDEGISVDASWPLFIQHAGGYSLGYIAAEGLEFETGDRNANEISAAGGSASWVDQLDADPHRWSHRLNLARLEVDAMLTYADMRRPNMDSPDAAPTPAGSPGSPGGCPGRGGD